MKNNNQSIINILIINPRHLTRYVILFFCALAYNGIVYAQAPNISYASPQTFTVNSPAPNLGPSNSGGYVPAFAYGQVTTFPGIAAGINSPSALARDAQGDIYLTVSGSNQIRKISTSGDVSVFAGSSAGLQAPAGMAIDAQGNVYVGDLNDARIHKITPAGVGSIFAGSGSFGYQDGPALSARFINPTGLAIDANSNIYVADGYNQRIRKITPAGDVSTLAGSGAAGHANGQGTAASFNIPFGVACDVAGNIYVTDQNNRLIRKITPAGLVSTFAGSGFANSTNGTGTAASFNAPNGITVDSLGNVYVADATNNRIRKISPAGAVSTLAGNGSFGLTDGIGQAATISHPTGIVMGLFGYLYASTEAIRIINTTGFAISHPLPAGLVFGATNGEINGTPTVLSAAKLDTITAYNLLGSSSATISIKVTNGNPSANDNLVGLTISNGTLSPSFAAATNNYSASVNNATTAITLTPTASDAGAAILVNGTQVASGAASASISLAGGPNTISVLVTAPDGVTSKTYTIIVTRVTPSPTVSYSSSVTYTAGAAIAALAPTSTFIAAPAYNGSPVTLGSGFSSPIGVAADPAGNVYVAGNLDGRVTKIPVGGGSPVSLGTFNSPYGVAVNAAGDVYVAAKNNPAIMKIPHGGGSPVSVGSGFSTPYSVALDAAGNVYVADPGSSTIQEIPVGSSIPVSISSHIADPTGVTVDAAGNVYVADYNQNALKVLPANGGLPVVVASGFNFPFGVAVDATGNLYVADQNNNAIKKIPAGGGGAVSIGSGFNGPAGVTTDGAGNVYVADENNNAIKVIKPIGGYFISPFLPAGLKFDNATGIISGTPVAALPATNFTITGYNSFGNSKATVNITVNLPALPAISYASPKTYNVGSAITPLAPTGSGVSATVYANRTMLGLGFGFTNGVAVDVAGNVYVGDANAGAVKEIPAGGGAPVIVGAGFVQPFGIALDAAGNIYVADFGGSAVKKIPNGGGAITTLGSGFMRPAGIAVDAAGNVYVTDEYNSNVTKIPVAGGPQVVLGAGFVNPVGVAVDATGNVYVADQSISAIEKIPVGSNISVNKGSGLNGFPNAIAVDAIGNIYVSNGQNDALKEIRASDGAIITVGAGYSYPTAIAVDGKGTVYFADSGTSSPVGEYKPVGGYFLNTSLPTGLSFDTSTGIISGTPTAASAAKNYVVTGYNLAGGSSATANIQVTNNSSDARLAGLNLSTGPFSFRPDTTNYAISVGNSTTSVTVTPFTNNGNATVKVNGAMVVSGTASSAIPLLVGDNTIATVVTAQDGVTKITYTIVITRLSNNADLSGLATSQGSLTPVFAPATTSYADLVTNATTSIAVTPATSSPVASVKVNGIAITSGTASAAIPLVVGPNSVTIAVTAQDGTTTKTYTITVTRAPSSNANLASLTMSNGMLTPVFASALVSYKDTVNYGTSAVYVTPSSADPNATIKVNGVTVVSGVTSPYQTLSVGSNAITIVVTALDGTTTKTYTVNVTRRAPSIVATLSNLTISSGNLTPAFVSTTASYTASVPASILAITITPTKSDTGATIKVNGIAVTSGTASASIPLIVGPNTITIAVTAQDGVTVKTYTVVVTRLLAVPAIGYTGPKTYFTNVAITALAPNSTGGAVAPVGYNTSTITIGSGFSQPNGVAVDAAGNVYVADYVNNAVKKIPVGGGAPIILGSAFSHPRNVAVDAAGNVFVADGGNNAIKEIPVGGGAVLTLGSGFSQPNGVAVDAAGNVYVGDYGNSLVKKIPAGNGTPVVIGSGFNHPRGVAVDAAGNVFVADGGNTAVKKIPGGGGTTVSLGSGFGLTTGVAVDASGIVYVSDYGNSAVKMIAVGGGAPVSIGSGFSSPYGVAVDGAGRVYVGDLGNNAVKTIKPNGGYYINTSLPAGLTFANATGIISGTPTLASPSTNYAITAYNAAGNGQATVNITVKVLTLPAISYTGPQTYTAGVAITPLSPSNTGGPVAPVSYNTSTITIGSGFSQPNGVAVDAAGNVFVADYLNNAVKKIPVGGGAPITLGSGFSHPRNVAVDAAGNVFVADGGNNAIKMIPVGGGAVVILGFGFNQPNGVAVDAAGNVYVGDYGNSAVKKIPAGNGTPVIIGSGFNLPRSVAVDAAGNVYVADGGHTAIKKIPFGGGATRSIGSGFGLTTGVAVDASGNVYVGDYGNNAVKMIPVGGGAPLSIGSGFSSPYGVAVDGAGKVYVGDLANNSVKVIKPLGGYYIGSLLPAGLTFTNATGIISGTPIVSSPATNYTITAYNTLGSAAATVNIKVAGNANLAGLTIDSGKLSPAFTPATISYKDTVINTTASVTVTPTAVVGSSSIKVNGTLVASGMRSAAIPLIVGNNTITTVVTAQDGVTTKTYTITVRRLTPGGLNSVYIGGNREQKPMVTSLAENVKANNILSPNGDGINDIWVVKNIAFYPDNIVTVFDRAGKIVFTRKGYANDWGGTYRGSVLSDGTYHYIIDLGNGTNIIGFITVVNR